MLKLKNGPPGLENAFYRYLSCIECCGGEQPCQCTHCRAGYTKAFHCKDTAVRDLVRLTLPHRVYVFNNGCALVVKSKDEIHVIGGIQSITDCTHFMTSV